MSYPVHDFILNGDEKENYDLLLPEPKPYDTWRFSEASSTTAGDSCNDVEDSERWTFEQVYNLALHLVVILLALLLWVSRMESPTAGSACTQGRSWSPVLASVEHEINGENALDHQKLSKYSGPPTKMLDQEWDDLVRPIHFRATREEMEHAGETIEDAVELSDGGYLATTAVYHELHCLRRLRWYLYRDQYYPNMTAPQEEYLRGHLDHCIEALRMTIMCHGNSALYSFTWPNSTDLNQALQRPVAKSNGKDVCVKWQSIEDWSYSRMVAPDHLLKRPLNVAIGAFIRSGGFLDISSCK